RSAAPRPRRSRRRPRRGVRRGVRGPSPHERSDLPRQGVADADRRDEHHVLGERLGVEPAQLERLLPTRERSRAHGALEDAAHVVDHVAVGIRDDLVVDGVGVDPDETHRLHLEPGLLAHLAHDRLPDRLARLDATARQPPAPRVVATLQENPLVREDHRRHPGSDLHGRHSRGAHAGVASAAPGWQRRARGVSDRAMIPADETFDATWPYAARFHEVPATGAARAFRMHYVDEGPPSAEAIVCLHGEPTWGYLY